MDTVSPELDARSRKSAQVLRNSLLSKGQRATADALGMSESAISRLKSEGELEFFARLLTALGLKPVPVTAKCVSIERAEEIDREFSALKVLAERGLSRMKAPNIGSAQADDTGLHFE